MSQRGFYNSGRTTLCVINQFMDLIALTHCPLGDLNGILIDFLANFMISKVSLMTLPLEKCQ